MPTPGVFKFPPRVPPVGLKHLELGNNGDVADGISMGAVSAFINSLSRRCKILGHSGLYLSSGGVLVSSAGRCRFYTSPMPSDVYVWMLFTRTNSATALANYTWTVGGTAQTTKYVPGNTVALGGTADLFYDVQRFVTGGGASLSGSTAYDATLAISGNLFLMAYVIYEVPKISLGSDWLKSSFYLSSYVTGDDLTSMTSKAWTRYKDGGATQLHYAGQTAPAAVTSTTFTNILDGATTGWASTAAGFWVWMDKKGTLTNRNVNCTFWCNAKSSAGTSGEVRFVNSGGVIATITGIGAEGFYSTTATLPDTTASELIIVEHRNSAGATTTTTYAVGIYERET